MKWKKSEMLQLQKMVADHIGTDQETKAFAKAAKKLKKTAQPGPETLLTQSPIFDTSFKRPFIGHFIRLRLNTLQLVGAKTSFIPT